MAKKKKTADGGYETTDDYDDLLFDVRRSVRYHDLRRQHFERMNQFIVFVAFLLGTGTLATFIEDVDAPLPLKLLLPVLTTFLLGISLVYRVGPKASLSNDLKRRFINLEQAMVPKKKKWTTGELAAWTRERLAIEAEELPVKRVLDTMCHNDMLRARGFDEEHDDWWHVGPLQRLFAQFFDYRRHSRVRRNGVRALAEEIHGAIPQDRTGGINGIARLNTGHGRPEGATPEATGDDSHAEVSRLPAEPPPRQLRALQRTDGVRTVLLGRIQYRT